MSTAVWTDRFELSSFADDALKRATRFFFVVTFAGQLLFAFTIAAHYGMATARGSLQTFNKHLTHGWQPGDGMGNLAIATHLVSALVIILAGTLQLVPRIRERAPAVHRWTGRVYFATAFAVSLAGLFLMWLRPSSGDFSQHLGNTLMAVLIMVSAVMALRHARRRDIRAHRVWALRLYLVVSASLFIRAGIFLSFLVYGGPFGFDPATFTGPFLTFMAFAQYLVPLAVLELFLRVRANGGAAGRSLLAAGLGLSALALAAGTVAVTMAIWLPSLKRAFDARTSIADTLSATIASRGIDAAVAQYGALKTAGAVGYNFDEGELNGLGYRLLRDKRVKDAIRIFGLNSEAYPMSSNVFDSLGEAYLNDGDKALAIANYDRAVALDPKNGNSLAMLRKLQQALD